MNIKKKLLVFGILGSAIPLVFFGTISHWQSAKVEETAAQVSARIATASLNSIIEGLNAMLVSQQDILLPTNFIC